MFQPVAYLLLAALIGGGTAHPATDTEPNPPKEIQGILRSAPDCREVAALYNYAPVKANTAHATFVVWYCIGAEIPLP